MRKPARKTQIGTVRSTKMKKTVVVEFIRSMPHPKYEKFIRKRAKLYAHDEKSECKPGDRVLVMQTRPLSRLKHWRVVRKLEQ